MNARTSKLIRRYCLFMGDPFKLKRNARNERRKWNRLTPYERRQKRLEMAGLL